MTELGEVTKIDFMPCVNAFDGQPYVAMELTFDDRAVRRAGHMTPDEAREYAMGVVVAAEAAIQDAAVAAWLCTRMAFPGEAAAQAVAELRGFRRAQAAEEHDAGCED